MYSSSDRVACRLTHTVPCAHQKPITALKAAAGRLVTGSQDHTLRVSAGCLLGAGTEDGERLGTVRVRLEVSWMNCGRDCLARVESGKTSDQSLVPIPALGVPPGGLVLSLHPAGPLGGHHDCVH